MTVREAGAEHRDEGNREKDAGERHQHIDDPADHVVHTTAKITGDRADEHADDRGHRNHGETHEQ